MVKNPMQENIPKADYKNDNSLHNNVKQNTTQQINEKIKEIGSDFHSVKLLMQELLRNNSSKKGLNEDDSWENTFKKLQMELSGLYWNIAYVNRMKMDNDIDAEMVNNVTEASKAAMDGINAEVKLTFAKSNSGWFSSLQKNTDWNFKMQVAYYACVIVIKSYLALVERMQKIHKNISNPFSLVDLMANMPENDKTFIKNSSDYSNRPVGGEYPASAIKQQQTLTKKAQAFVDVCEKITRLGLSFKKLLKYMKSLNESEFVIESYSVDEFKRMIDDVIEDYNNIKQTFNTYKTIPFENLNFKEVIANIDGLVFTLSCAHNILMEHKFNPNKYKEPRCEALLSKVIGTGQTYRNPATGKIEQTDKGLIRELFELARQLLETVNKQPINLTNEFKRTNDYMKSVMEQHKWN